jgi:dTMP kinase
LARTARRRARTGADRPPEDRFEREETEFHEKVRAGFLELARAEPERFRIVDAAPSAVEVTEQIRKIIDREVL